VTLFPGSTVFTTSVTNFAISYDFSTDGSLKISVGTFALTIGQALKVTASGVIITPDQTTILTIASASISSPEFAQFGSGTLTNFTVTQTGFSWAA